MVLCVVIGCSNCSGRDKVSFYRIPRVIINKGPTIEELSKRQRDGYLAAISREDLTDHVIKNNRICSNHFISGKPASLEDELNPDWLPTQNLGHSKVDQQNVKCAQERYERQKMRQEAAVGMYKVQPANHETASSEDDKTVTSGVQTELTAQHTLLFQNELYKANARICVLEEQLRTSTQLFTIELTICQDAKFIQFYTGLPNFNILKAVYEFMRPEQVAGMCKLTPFQELMMTLIKLRLNPSMQDLAYRFNISNSTVSRIFLKWLVMLDTKLKSLILWPEREDLRRTMPVCFSSSFGNKVAVVIDCFEVFIERPSNLLARAATWSSYKHHNTVKFLIAITPQGVISYISDAWGGRVSDKYLTEHCGILSKLLPGDVVLADRGFDIADSVGMCQAKLHIPAFTKGKNQLTALEVEQTRTIANVRIHVERVIGLVRQKYTILQGTLPIQYVTTKSAEDDCTTVDHIGRICCALCNLNDSVVPFE